jgi:hypothetical protein
MILTFAEQDLDGISEPAKREINKFILERHGEDNGVAIAFKFFDFETCDAIDLCWAKVTWLRWLCVASVLISFFDPPPLPFVSLTLHSTQQLRDDDVQPLGANLGRFKRLKEIIMVSRGMP